MDTFKKIGSSAALWIGLLLVLCTLISLLYSTSLWFIQVFHFPRLQAFLVLLVCILLYTLIKRKQAVAGYVVAMVAALLINAWHLYPYTPLSKEQVAAAQPSATHNAGRFSLMLANVYMKNRQADSFLSMVHRYQPSLILAMEVDKWWVQQLRPLQSQYPYRILFPASNTYGMALYAKFPLYNSHTLFFNHDSVPAFLTEVKLPGGAAFQLLTIHPVAPMSSTHPDNVHKKEVGLIRAAQTVKGAALPVLVAGDFNDVGWSPNTRRFERISGLKDIRHGRGLYNTFSAHNVLMRWPLDYIYVSRQFKVASIRRLPSFGSDHFPFYAELVLEP